MKPKITVIIATYNSAATLERALKSVLSQTLIEKELLVIDGASTDDTLSIIQKYEHGIHWWHSEKDRGVYDAWNKALPKAQGEWICFLGSDDYFWDTEVLKKASEKLSQLPSDTRLAYGQVAVVSKTGDTIGMEGEPWSSYQHRSLDEMVIPHQGTFHRKELFEKTGGFKPEFKICGDFELVLRELLHGKPPAFLPDFVVAGMSIGGLSSTLENAPKIIVELKLARTTHGLSSFSPRLFARSVRAPVRRFLDKTLGKRIMNPLVDFYRGLMGKPKLWTRKDL